MSNRRVRFASSGTERAGTTFAYMPNETGHDVTVIEREAMWEMAPRC